MRRRGFIATIAAACVGASGSKAVALPVQNTSAYMSFQCGFAHMAQFHVYHPDGKLAMARHVRQMAAYEWALIIAKEAKARFSVPVSLYLSHDMFCSPYGGPSLADQFRSVLTVENPLIRIERQTSRYNWPTLHHA